MADFVKLTYGEMMNNCIKLDNHAAEFEQTSANVMSLVGQFTGAWEGEAEVKFEDDYNILNKSMETAVATMREITTLVRDYVSAMQEVESTFGKSHVTVG